MLKKIFILLFFFFNMIAVSQAQEEVYFQPIYNITITGNRTLLEAEIFQMITRNVRAGQRIQMERIQSDLEALYSTGYFSNVSANYYLQRDGVQVVYILEENPVIKKVSISGNESFSKEYLLRLIKNQPGQVLNYYLLDQDIKKINNLYVDAGYELSQVSDIFFDQEEQILYLKIQEVHIGKIKITGAEDLKEILLYRELETKPGDTFNTISLRQDRARLLNTGLLGKASSPLLEISPEPGKVDVNFDVEGRKTNQVNFGYGISSREQFGFVKLTLLNFFKWGETMSLRIQNGYDLGKEKQTYRFRYYTPWFLERRMSFAYERYLEQHYENLVENGEIIDFLEIKRDGWGMELGWLNINSWYISNEYYEEDISEVISEPTIHYSKRSLAMNFIFNTVKNDSYNNAASGEYGKLRLESGGYLGKTFGYDLDLGGRTFGRYELNYSRFLSFDLGKIAAIRTQTGIFNVEGTRPILEGEQYAVGGSNTVRGYLDIYPFAVGS
ncbi:MAG: BamA/TamA family outer membrane protein, partial [Candidatus Margulisbacteria bacterium]|nr:BamA/TamA family outer membrane protein [Candidatus Margulisiibacteriota bacterium]